MKLNCKTAVFILLLLPCFNTLYAQNTSDSLAGEYHLQGVMETASALLLKSDSTFELYYSYGAIDRQGSGIWQFEDGRIRLNSRPKPKVDFALSTSKKTSEDVTTVKVLSENTNILEHFEVMIRAADGQNYGKTDNEGIFLVPKTKVTGIELFFAFCPERFSSFPIKSDHNYFEFKIEPWIAEIFAEDVILTVQQERLIGQHPLLQGDKFEFVKAN
jgi:hypothetical protein